MALQPSSGLRIRCQVAQARRAMCAISSDSVAEDGGDPPSCSSDGYVARVVARLRRRRWLGADPPLARSTHPPLFLKGGVPASGWYCGGELRRERPKSGTVGREVPMSLGVATGQRTTNPLARGTATKVRSQRGRGFVYVVIASVVRD